MQNKNMIELQNKLLKNESPLFTHCWNFNRKKLQLINFSEKI